MENGTFPEGPIALDCEMVGVGESNKGALGRVSIVGYNGEVLYDVISKPEEPVTFYRTKYSGIRPQDMENGLPFQKVQDDVRRLIQVC